MGYTIVEYYSDHEAYKCGYCKSKDTNYSRGMWAHCMTVDDYQSLLNRGWRRSGQYCYKPTMDKTCCPLYTIRCESWNFKLSKSQKKVLKKVNKFLRTGIKPGKVKQESAESKDEGCDEHFEDAPQAPSRVPSEGIMSCDAPENPENRSKNQENMAIRKSILGYDPHLPHQKKAKVIRRENSTQKNSQNQTNAAKTSEEKSLEDYLSEATDSTNKHSLKICLVRSTPRTEEYKDSVDDSFAIYRKYQKQIHGDSYQKCNERQFIRFLADSPLQEDKRSSGPPCGYGSFNEQYWLDDKLIAVAVIDILPECVSSVYFYYDPEYNFLSLGTYSALKEIALTRKLKKSSADLKYYYMGYYTHTCPKLTYKAKYTPSFLQCPETYKFFPISECFPKLDVKVYSRFNSDETYVDEDEEVDLNEVAILHDQAKMTYRQYCMEASLSKPDSDTLQYAKLVGSKLSQSILLFKL